MKIFVADTYEAISKQAADDAVQVLQFSKQPLICTASGDSPTGLYKEIVDRAKKKQLDISNWLFVGLDEWAGMNGNDEGSCRYHLNQQLFGPLQTEDNKICFFNGRANDLEMECQRVENFIQQ